MTVHPEYLKVRFRGGDEVEWPPSFVIITAFATTGEVWADKENREADFRMKAALEERGVWHWRLTGYSPETGHAEPGWAVELGLEEGLKVGRRFLQDAIYHVEGDRLTVVLCRPVGTGEVGDAQPVREAREVGEARAVGEAGEVRRGAALTVEVGSFRQRLTPAGGSSGPGTKPDLPPVPGG